jgi:hypothetical protein
MIVMGVRSCAALNLLAGMIISAGYTTLFSSAIWFAPTTVRLWDLTSFALDRVEK